MPGHPRSLASRLVEKRFEDTAVRSASYGLRGFSSYVPRRTSSTQRGAGQEPGNDGHSFLPAEARFHDTHDIHVNDLGATLEAHRARNIAKIIRPVQAPSDPGVKHLLPERPYDSINCEEACPTGDNLQIAKKAIQQGQPSKLLASRVKSDRRKPWEFWPAGSIQHQGSIGSKKEAPSGSVLEYHARSIDPVGIWKRPHTKDDNPDWFRPWHRHLKEQGGDSLQRLGNEITAFEQYMTPSDSELKATTRVVSQVERVISSSLKNCSCKVIGSYSTGLAMPYSDIDFAVSLPDIEKEAMKFRKSLNSLKYQKIYRRVLFKLQQAFAKDVNFTNDARIIYARVPIVQVTHRTTGQEIQVQISTGIHQQQQHTLAYLAEYPTLRSLYFAIRSCLELRRLNITFEGGLGSYAMLILIVNALKHTSGQHDPHDVGNQLLHVLEFYSNSDLYRVGFSVDPPRTFRKGGIPATAEERLARASDPVLRGIDLIAKANLQKPYLLCLQDPADPTNDLGRKAYSIKHIQQTFATARNTMVSDMEAWDQRRNVTTPKHDDTGLLDALINGNYRRFDYNRRMIEDFGSPFKSMKSKRSSSKIRKISTREMLEKIDEVGKRKAASSIRNKA